jgi:Zn-dependent protease
MRFPINRHRRTPGGDDDGVLWRGWFHLGSSHKIELSLHLFFVLTVVVVTSVLAFAFFPHVFPGWPTHSYWLVAIAVAATDSLAGLLHELGHAIVALARGRRVYRITLYGLAAAARRSSGPARPRDQVAIALAGPLSHLLVASALLFTWTVLPHDNEPLRVAAGFPALSNFTVGLLNLLPVSPLDGGRAAKALIAAILRV